MSATDTRDVGHEAIVDAFWDIMQQGIHRLLIEQAARRAAAVGASEILVPVQIGHLPRMRTTLAEHGVVFDREKVQAALARRLADDPILQELTTASFAVVIRGSAGAPWQN